MRRGGEPDPGGGTTASLPRSAVDVDPLRPAFQDSARPFAVGDRIGRYELRERLGAGGMGEVFAAYDPELDRMVALKQIRADLAQASEAARLRFQREAQAMARLNHPNVVSVYDVIAVGRRVIVAMELIDGPTLRQWLASTTRRWHEIVPAMIEAGRGLEAAHAAGIVHRDFKPSNVIVGDRIRVADFGLARASHHDELAIAGSPTPLDVTVTHPGAGLGTAAYVAPEVKRGEAATPASDQYAFAVTLHEAILGARPGSPPDGSRTAPSWLRAIIARGLHEDPAQRYPSMTHLLAALGRDRRRRRQLAGAATAVVASSVVSIWLAGGHEGVECELAGRADGLWTPADRQGLAVAFAKARPYGAAIAASVTSRIEDYVRRWSEAKVDACSATHVRGEQSAELLDVRTRCLDDERVGLRALVTALARPDGPTVDRAVDAVDVLAPPSSCAASRLIGQSPLPELPGVKEVEAALAGLRAAMPLDHFREARSFAGAAMRGADQLRIPALRARALLGHGTVLAQTDLDGARAALEESLSEANRAGDRDTAMAATVHLLSNAAMSGEPRRIEALLPIAHAAVQGAPSDSPMRSKHATFAAKALVALGRHPEALAACAGSPDAGEACRCSVLAAARRFREARPVCEADLAATERRLGADNPVLATRIHNLGVVLNSMGEYRQALVYRERHLAMTRATFGDGTQGMVTSLQSHAAVLLNLERHDAAARSLEHAIAIADRIRRTPGEVDASLRFMLAKVEIARGLGDRAVALAREALAIAEKLVGRDHPSMIGHLYQFGASTYTVAAHREAALAAFRRGADMAFARGGTADPYWFIHMTMQAEVLVDLRRGREAVEVARRALAAAESAAPDPADLAEVRLVLGHALLLVGDRKAARGPLEAAREVFRQAGEGHRSNLDKVERLLAELR